MYCRSYSWSTLYRISIHRMKGSIGRICTPHIHIWSTCSTYTVPPPPVGERRGRPASPTRDRAKPTSNYSKNDWGNTPHELDARAGSDFEVRAFPIVFGLRAVGLKAFGALAKPPSRNRLGSHRSDSDASFCIRHCCPRAMHLIIGSRWSRKNRKTYKPPYSSERRFGGDHTLMLFARPCSGESHIARRQASSEMFVRRRTKAAEPEGRSPWTTQGNITIRKPPHHRSNAPYLACCTRRESYFRPLCLCDFCVSACC